MQLEIFDLRAITRRTFKTDRQLATGVAARWKIARLNLGWHEKPPNPEKKGSTVVAKIKGSSTKNETPRIHDDGKPQEFKLVLAGEVEKDSSSDDIPRKRAVVRNSRKNKVRLVIVSAIHLGYVGT